MKSNKGFTLIELLAVIVILAIIALIATPIILGVIETARQNSAKSSALGYVDAIEKQMAIDVLENTNVVDASSGTIELPVEELTIKGEAPTSGSLTVDATNGIITGGCMVIEIDASHSYAVTYEKNGSATAGKAGSTCESTPSAS